MKKRILIDATTVVEKVDGLSQYIINLLTHFPVSAFEKFEFSVLINKGVQRKEIWDILNEGRFKIIETNIAPIGPRRDWDMFWFLRSHKKSFDLFHSTSNQYPLFLKKGIATVHDITFRKYFDMPWWTFQMATRYLNKVIRNSLKKAAAVIAVSHATKHDLLESYGSKFDKKIHVIHEGWEHFIQENRQLHVNVADFDFKDYIFYVGTTRKHKNMKNLLRAFSIALKDLPGNIKLVLSGSTDYLDKEDKLLINKINAASERLVFTGYVSNEALAYLFSKADAFIFPSLSEGFGIPILEAFYFNKPVLCSNITSLPEIAGEAAIYFDPFDPKGIAAAMLSFYGNESLKNALIEKGKKQLAKFSWKKTVAETISLYEQVLIRTPMD